MNQIPALIRVFAYLSLLTVGGGMAAFPEMKILTVDVHKWLTFPQLIHLYPLQFDFDREPATFARSRQIYDALSFDLRALKNRGGKILLWHGWADGVTMATSSIGYYEGVMKYMGGCKATE